MGSIASSENEGPAVLPPKSDFHLCRCGHIKGGHVRNGDTLCSLCRCQGFVCDHTRCGWKPREEKPKPCSCGPDEACGDPCVPASSSTECGHPDNDPCDRCLMPRSYYIRCGCGHVQGEHRTFEAGGCTNCRCKSFAPPPEEPPMTPEEEEQAPPDEEACDHQCRCGHDHWDHSSSGYCKQCDCESSSGHYVTDCPWAPEDENACQDCLRGAHGPNTHRKDLPPFDLAEYTPCVCGHEPSDHAGVMGAGECGECDCSAYRTEPDFELPPQPDRRPPYAVAYSVQGHLYEVALPGDATVRAVDGSLIIQHHLGPIAGIVQVLPVINEESNA